MRSSRFKRSFPRSREGWMGRSLRSKLLSVDLVFSRTAGKVVAQLVSSFFFLFLLKVVIFFLSSAGGWKVSVDIAVGGRLQGAPFSLRSRRWRRSLILTHKTLLRLPLSFAKAVDGLNQIGIIVYGGPSSPCRKGTRVARPSLTSRTAESLWAMRLHFFTIIKNLSLGLAQVSLICVTPFFLRPWLRHVHEKVPFLFSSARLLQPFHRIGQRR